MVFCVFVIYRWGVISRLIYPDEYAGLYIHLDLTYHPVVSKIDTENIYDALNIL